MAGESYFSLYTYAFEAFEECATYTHCQMVVSNTDWRGRPPGSNPSSTNNELYNVGQALRLTSNVGIGGYLIRLLGRLNDLICIRSLCRAVAQEDCSRGSG